MIGKWLRRLPYIALAAIIAVIIAAGTAYFVERGYILSDPSIALGGEWKKDLPDLVFLQYTSRRDGRLSYLVDNYIYRLNENTPDLPTLTDSDRLILRNFFFAIHGYTFTRSDLASPARCRRSARTNSTS